MPDALVNGGDSAALGRFIKLLLISYRFSGVFALFFDDYDLLMGLQKIANEKLDHATRATRLQPEPPVVRALEFDEDFWALMRGSPQFHNQDTTIGILLRWFRNDAGVSS